MHLYYYLLAYLLVVILFVKGISFGSKNDNVTDLLIEDDTTRFYNE